MELSIPEAKTRLAEVADAAARGERVGVTKDGRPSFEMVPAQRAVGMGFAKAAPVRRALEIDGLNAELLTNLNPGFSTQVLGLER